MSVETIPHESWAEVYDMVYERSFGRLYENLTELTIETITNLITPQSKVVDFGAGTGRLSVPLSQLGYKVTAVEPSQEMLDQLKQKVPASSIDTVVSSMQDYKGRGDHDLALCVFTVLLYLLDEKSLRDALTSAYDSLKQDALFLIDIPSKLLFNSYSFNDEKISRNVDIEHVRNDVYEYFENLTISMEDQEKAEYTDTFQIKYWSKEKVFTILEEIGFILVSDLSTQFSGTGSQYYVLKKSVKAL